LLAERIFSTLFYNDLQLPPNGTPNLIYRVEISKVVSLSLL